MSWLIAMSKPNREFQTYENVLNGCDKTSKKKLFKAYQPKFEETYWERGRKRSRPIPLLGGYIFVQWTSHWRRVLDIDGITGVLRADTSEYFDISETKDGYWLLQVYDNRGYRETRSFKSYDEAAAERKALESNLGKPSLVGDDVLREIRSLERNGFVVGLQEGQPVRVKEGLFANALGRFNKFTKHGREIVFLDLLNRTVRAELPAKALVPA
jgi:transcription antitermination factor NusG